MIKGYQTQIMDIYEKIRTQEQNALVKRKEEITKLHPQIIALDEQIRKLCINLSLSVLKKARDIDNTLNTLREDITDLRVKKCELLVSKGYSPEYLNIHYHCTKCKDTGYIGIDKCKCFKQKLVHLYYKNSDLQDSIKINNFNTFDINLYSSDIIDDNKYSPRKNMEMILNKIYNDYLPNFKTINDNLLFYGNPGTGKTFLCRCLAKELLDRGFLVVYRTSDELIKNLRDIRFENNDVLEDLLINCDLLIIDDLGAEQVTDFSVTELFTFLNKKILKNRKIIISTNLPLPRFSTTYSERISSRLLGNFTLQKIYGEDIRVNKNLVKSKQYLFK